LKTSLYINSYQMTQRGFIFLCVLLGCSSCINITENCTFKKNGSGRMNLEITFSYLKMFGSEASTLPNIQRFDSIKTGLDKLEKISDIALTLDSTAYSLSIAFDFDDPQALNDALSWLYHGDVQPSFDFYEWKEEQMIRNYPETFATNFQKTWSYWAEEPLDDHYLRSINIRHQYEYKDNVVLIYTPTSAEILGDKNKQANIYLPLSYLFDQPAPNFRVVWE